MEQRDRPWRKNAAADLDEESSLEFDETLDNYDIGTFNKKRTKKRGYGQSLHIQPEKPEKVTVQNYEDAHSVIQDFVTYRARKQLKYEFQKLMIKNKAPLLSQRSIGPNSVLERDDDDDSDDEDVKDPLKD